MTTSPLSLDALVVHVQQLQPGADPLAQLGNAVSVAHDTASIGDQLIGHFVEIARLSGATWSEVGDALGVSKQAVQKRFVARWDGSDPIPATPPFARYTDFARQVVLIAAEVAAGNDSHEVDVRDLVVGMAAVTGGIAARVIRSAGATEKSNDGDAAVLSALGCVSWTGVVPKPMKRGLDTIAFTLDAGAALQAARESALGLGHNYIGTEHLLLGALSIPSIAIALEPLGVTGPAVDDRVRNELIPTKS
jgi:hypothetical protein